MSTPNQRFTKDLEDAGTSHNVCLPTAAWFPLRRSVSFPLGYQMTAEGLGVDRRG